MLWFTSDTHFGHANVLRFSSRPWNDIDNMNKALVANINACVGPKDELYILGDFSYKIPAEEARKIRKQIKCQKVHLIPGNHDKDWTTESLAGTFIIERDVLQLKIEQHKLILSHYPMMDWRSMSHGSIHLHGHIHSQGTDYNDLNLAQGIYRMDVGVDAHNFLPVSLTSIIERFKNTPNIGRVKWQQWAVLANTEKAAV